MDVRIKKSVAGISGSKNGKSAGGKKHAMTIETALSHYMNKETEMVSPKTLETARKVICRETDKEWKDAKKDLESLYDKYGLRNK